MLIDIAAAETVIIVASAVFRDPQGAGQNFLQFCGAFGNAGRIDLPIQVVTGTVFPHAVADAGNGGAGIVIEADKVSVFTLGEFAVIAQREMENTQSHGLRQGILE